jgi:Tfp pilus assembly protein PilF
VVWPASPPVPAGPPAEAVAQFQRGMEALQRKRYAEASESFRELLSNFSNERALLDRARVYLELCERELRRQPANPQTVEERLTAATAALNNDDDRTAEALAKGVLAEHPDQDLALYLLAAIASRRGSIDSALELLGRAIDFSPEAGQQARHDPDFDALHDTELFWKLTDKRHASAAARLIKSRRRAER